MNLPYFQGWQNKFMHPLRGFVNNDRYQTFLFLFLFLTSSLFSLIPGALRLALPNESDWEARMVIMSLRPVLRKLGTNRSTYSNTRSVLLGASQSAAVNNNFRNPRV